MNTDNGAPAPAPAPARARAPAPARRAGNQRIVHPRGAARPNLPNDINAPTQVMSYHRILLEMMSEKDNELYPLDRVFTE